MPNAVHYLNKMQQDAKGKLEVGRDSSLLYSIHRSKQ